MSEEIKLLLADLIAALLFVQESGGVKDRFDGIVSPRLISNEKENLPNHFRSSFL